MATTVNIRNDKERKKQKKLDRKSAALMLGFGVIQLIAYYNLYTKYKDKWKENLDKKIKYIDYLHRYYIDTYNVNKTFIYDSVQAIQPYDLNVAEFARYAVMLGLVDGNTTNEEELYTVVNRGTGKKSKLVHCARRQKEYVSMQRRLRDIEGLNLQYSRYIMDTKQTFMKFGSSEVNQMLTHIDNAANINKGFMDMASMGTSAALNTIGLSYKNWYGPSTNTDKDNSASSSSKSTSQSTTSSGILGDIGGFNNKR